MLIRPFERTASLETGAEAPAISFAPSRVSEGDFAEELRQLLRSRLILVHVLALLYAVLLKVVTMASPASDSFTQPDQGNPWRFLPVVFECVAGAIVLWRRPAMSWRWLRLWEVSHFFITVAFYGCLRFEMLAYNAWAAPDPLTIVPFSGAVTLFAFTTMILAYGVLIPNTRQRSLVGVAAITAVPFLTIAAAALVNPALRDGHLVPLLMQAAANLTFPAAIAVFAATRAATLHQRAFEAERRAEQVGKYVLKRKLGQGGMGEVWLAEHGTLRRPCAVKFIRPDVAAHPTTAARFAREVQAVTTLTHVNTVRVYDYGRARDGSFYYVMEYLDGPTLEALVRRVGPLGPARVVYLLRQVCGALSEAHGAGLVHRDLKPGNIIIAKLGGQWDVAKLLDFGLVEDLSHEAGDRLTRPGTVLGTPAYMSPEQAAGEAVVDARSDVYSLGTVAFFALTGRPPFQEKTLGQILAAHRTIVPPALHEQWPEVPADLSAVVARCLAKDPGERYPSAAAVEQALTACGCANAWSPRDAAAWWRATG